MKKRPSPRPPARRASHAPASAKVPLPRKLLFSAVTVLAALGLLEGMARVVVRVVPNSRFEAHNRLIDATGLPALNGVLAPDPLLFWSLKPNLPPTVLEGRIAASSGMHFTVSTDERGCRRLPVADAPRRLVAFLGDSCTFGVGVDNQERFAALLQSRLPGVQSVDLGVPGYTALQGRLRLEHFPFPMPPRVVVITFGFNDAAPWDNVSDLEHAARLRTARSWLTHSSLLTALASAFQQTPPSARDSSGSDHAPAARRPRLSDEEFAAEIRTIVVWCRERGAVPVLVVWPFRGQLVRDDLTSKQQLLLRLADELHVPGVNLVPVFRAQGGRALFADVVHASRTGHVTVANALEPVIAGLLGTGAGAAGRSERPQ